MAEREIERGSGLAGPSETIGSGADSREARPKAEPTAIEQDRDDPSRLAEEAASQVAKQAADLRAVKVPMETEPPTTFRP